MADYSNVSFKNDGKLKLLIIVGTRPEIIRLAAVINKTRKYFDVILAHTGQNYDYNLNGVFFHDLQLDDPEVARTSVCRKKLIDALLTLFLTLTWRILNMLVVIWQTQVFLRNALM